MSANMTPAIPPNRPPPPPLPPSLLSSLLSNSKDADPNLSSKLAKMAPAVPPNPTPASVISLLSKVNDADADLRYMSLNDLHNVLNAGAPGFLISDYHTCAKTVECLLETLDDTHGDVQNQAIKCLGALILKINVDILAPLIEKLTNLKTTNSVDTSIHTTALRTVILSFPRPVIGQAPLKITQDGYLALSRVLIPRLVGYTVIPHGAKNQPTLPKPMLELNAEKGVDSDAIDVLIELIRCFGPMLRDAEKEAFQKVLMRILNDERTSSITKKKVVMAISNLAIYLPDRLLSAFVSTMIENFRSTLLTYPNQRLLITTAGSLARSIPQRFGPYLKTLVPFILSPLNEAEYNQAVDEFAEAEAPNQELEEVREAALVALEGFLSSCSAEMRPFIEDSISAGLRYLSYDPNNAICADEDDEQMGGTLDDETGGLRANGLDGGNDDIEEDFEEEGVLSDDDDTSWKVRRCAAKALYAIISTRGSGDLIDNGTLYDKVAPVLIARFKEREENVRLEILATLAALIRKTGEVLLISTSAISVNREIGYAASYAAQSRKRRRDSTETNTYDSHKNRSFTFGPSSPTESPSPVSGPKADLARITPAIVQGVAKLLKESSNSTKQEAIVVLRHIVTVLYGGLSKYLPKIIELIVDTVKPSYTNAGLISSSLTGIGAPGNKLRIEALQLIEAISQTHSVRVLSPYIGYIIAGVITSINDKQYKVSSEAILVVESIIRILTPPRSTGTEHQYRNYLVEIYDTIIDRAAGTDSDLEVRQRAIHALGVYLAHTSGLANSKELKTKRSTALGIIQDRLKNETTRLCSIQAVDMICASAKEAEDLPPIWVRHVALELGAQIRKADRVLRGTGLGALKNLSTNPTAVSCLDDATVSQLSGMLVLLLNPNDLNLLGLALIVIAKLADQSPKTVVNENLKKDLCNILLTPISGAVLESFLSLVEIIGEHGVGQPLMHSLLKDVGVNGDPAIVGKVIGTLLVSGASTVGVKLENFVAELQESKDEQRNCLALSILGEAGLRMGSSSPLRPNLFAAHFSSKSEQVSRAAAVALGRAGVSNINTYLPVILSSSTVSGSSQYLALHSIKEILQYASKTKSKTNIIPYTRQIWEKLLIASQGEDNKAVGAECIGRLTIVEPKIFLPLLQDYLHDPASTVRGMVVQALRFTFADSDETFDEVLKPTLVRMLATMLGDLSLENRRLALGALNSAAHNKPNILLPHLAQLLPLVMKESKIKSELVREVQMGPFKHKVDDGLEVRKTAYETLYSLLENAYTRMNPLDLYDRVIAGLNDEHEIKMLCNLMLAKLITLDPDESARRLDQVAEHFRAILTFKPKDTAVRQELEKNTEAGKSVLTITVLLHKAFPAASSPAASGQGQAWKAYWEWVAKEFRPQLLATELEVKTPVA